MAILRIHHFSLLVKDISVSIHFYQNELGLTLNPSRPEMGYNGAWFDVGVQQIHLLELPTTHQCDPNLHGGRDYHVAFHVDDLEWIKCKCEQLKLPFTVSKSGRKALFTRDPDGNALEFIEQN
ncbi:MAG: glyoxalase [Methylococcales bacterium]|nr:glyoxalase [Methylococcales bacterium]MBT7443604.1 glyoxalase [Methylococcales bacterium]